MLTCSLPLLACREARSTPLAADVNQTQEEMNAWGKGWTFKAVDGRHHLDSWLGGSGCFSTSKIITTNCLRSRIHEIVSDLMFAASLFNPNSVIVSARDNGLQFVRFFNMRTAGYPLKY